MDSQKLVQFGPITGICLGHAALGKPLMSVYCYVVDGALIDTSAKNNRAALQRLLPSYPITQIALTHYHEDHAGNAAYLHARFGWPVFASQKTCLRLSSAQRLRPYEHWMWGNLERMQATPFDRTFTTERYRFQIVESPGHSEDHIVLYEANQGWLFSGDMFLGPRIKYFRRDECLFTTIQSLNRLLSLEFDTLLCGHNPQTKNAKAMLAKKRDHLRELYGQVQQRFERGETKQQIVRELGRGREQHLVKLLTLGDVSYRHLLCSAIASLERGQGLAGLMFR